jgi:DNA-binding winged helix-turn-helix (wHTH) protein
MVPMDSNRLAEFSEWASYELMLHSLVVQSQSLDEDWNITQQLSELHREVVVSQNRLLAQRYVERAIGLLCSERGLRLTILIDEADSFYHAAEPRFLHNLRALRDEHKYKLCYVLFTRMPLERLRDPADAEAFYELFNRNTLGLKPYEPADAMRVAEQVETRRGYSLSQSERRSLVHYSGGHPGLLIAAIDALVEEGNREVDSPDWLFEKASIQTECQKLWDSLDSDERWSLIRTAAGYIDQDATPARKLLALKGLIVPAADERWEVFSPVFNFFVKQSGQQDIYDFRVDDGTASVWVTGKQITGLTPLEFSLVKLLYENRGQVQSRDDILLALHPEDFETGHTPEVQDSSVDSLVRRLRKKVEPVPSKPRYILTVRGHGYSLASPSEPEQI